MQCKMLYNLYVVLFYEISCRNDYLLVHHKNYERIHEF